LVEEAGEDPAYAINSVLIKEEFQRRLSAGEDSLAIFMDLGSRKPGFKMLAMELGLVKEAKGWPFEDPEHGTEAAEVLDTAIEKGKQGKAMSTVVEATAARKEFGSRIQVFYENISVGLGGSAVSLEQRAGNEVVRRLHKMEEEEELVTRTTEVRRISTTVGGSDMDGGARAQTPEDQAAMLKDDIDYLATAVTSEPSMLIAMSKIEKPKTMMSWPRALSVVHVGLDAVKDVPSKEKDQSELQLLVTLVEEAKSEVDLPFLTGQVRVVTEIRGQLAAKKGLRNILRTLGKHANNISRKILAEVLREMAEGQEAPIEKALMNAADLAENSTKSVILAR
jgi:hypothetical protein